MTETTKLSLAEMKVQLAALQNQIAEASAQETSEAIAKVRALITEHGLTAQQIFPSTGSTTSLKAKRVDDSGSEKKETKKVEPIWQDPISGSTWTGRGRAPVWIAGQDRSKFLIKKPTESEAAPQA